MRRPLGIYNEAVTPSVGICRLVVSTDKLKRLTHIHINTRRVVSQTYIKEPNTRFKCISINPMLPGAPYSTLIIYFLLPWLLWRHYMCYLPFNGMHWVKQFFFLSSSSMKMYKRGRRYPLYVLRESWWRKTLGVQKTRYFSVFEDFFSAQAT